MTDITKRIANNAHKMTCEIVNEYLNHEGHKLKITRISDPLTNNDGIYQYFIYVEQPKHISEYFRNRHPEVNHDEYNNGLAITNEGLMTIRFESE